MEAARSTSTTASKFLGRKRLFRVIRLQGESYKDCVYQLIDDHPESMEALGMLRYYKAPAGPVRWEDVEAAEIAMGKELTVNAYGWMPDAWTLFESDNAGAAQADTAKTHQMVAIRAFDYGDSRQNGRGIPWPTLLIPPPADIPTFLPAYSPNAPPYVFDMPPICNRRCI